MSKTSSPADPIRRPRAVSRRNVLKGAALGAAAAAAPAALTAGLSRPTAAAEQLTYAFWPWGSEIVADNARIFEEQYGEKINLQPIPGEYAAVLETKLASGAAIDMFWARNMSMAARSACSATRRS